MTRNGGKRMAARRRRLSGNPVARKNRYRGQTRLCDAMPTATCGDGGMLPHAIMSPRAWAKIRDVVNGNVITIDTHNCIIQGKGKLIASVGLRDLIIVDTDDAILICEKHKAGDIRKVTENLKICNRDEYL